MNIVLDSPVNGGLWLLSQYFKKCNSTLLYVLSGSHFHFEQCPADGWGLVGGGQWREGEDTVAVFVIQNQASEYPL